MSEFLTLHTKNIFDKNTCTIAYDIAMCGKLDLLKYILTLPGIDATYHCNLALPMAIHCHKINVVELLLAYHSVDQYTLRLSVVIWK